MRSAALRKMEARWAKGREDHEGLAARARDMAVEISEGEALV